MTEALIEQIEKVDWWNETARRVHGMPEGWRWFSLDGREKPPGFVLVTGAVPIGFITRGKNKGHPKWPPVAQGQKLWVKVSDFEESKVLWEQKTGKCSKCYGSGREWNGWSAIEGNTFKQCSKCESTGLAKPSV